MQVLGLTRRKGATLQTVLLGAFIVGAVAGCGGGVSGAAPMSAAPGQSAPLAIGQSNATATAAEAMVTPAALATVTTAGVAAIPAAVVPAALRRIDRRVAQLMLPGATVRPAGAATTTTACSVGGSFTVAASVDGKTLTVTFADCSELTGTSINGTQTYSDFTLTTQSASDSVSANVADALTLAVGALSFAEQGSYAFSLSAGKAANGSFTTETFALTGSSLEVAVSKSGTVADSATLSNFSFNFEEDQTVSPHQLYSSSDYTLASSRLNGTITVTTTQEFKQIADPAVIRLYPYTGQLVAAGASGGRLQVTVLGDETFVPPAGEGQIELQLDTGTGSFGPPIWLSWLTLEAAV